MRTHYKANIRRICRLKLLFSGNPIYLAALKNIVGFGVKNNLKCELWYRRESKSKLFSSCLMLAIAYPPNSFCSMSLSHLTAFTKVFLKMPITTFPAIRKSNVCAVFEGQTPCLLYTELNIISRKHDCILFQLTLHHTTALCQIRRCLIPTLSIWLCSTV